MGTIDTSEIEQLIENLSKQEVIELFNEYIYDLLKQLSTIANDPDINWAYNGVKDYTKLNQTFLGRL
jgi:predicted HTH transcriptional regulator